MKKSSFVVRIGFCVITFVLVSIFVLSAINISHSSMRSRGSSILEESIVKSVTLCYSIEGSYPPNLGYLLDNYGILYDNSKYFISYESFGKNLFPNIGVVEIGGR